MKILFYGDSITDANRHRDNPKGLGGLGFGYVRSLAEKLIGENPNEYEVINTGISGNRIVDLYSRIKADCWNFEPDVISILIGVNDVWHELGCGRNGVELDRFEKVYRMLIEDTKKHLPNVKMMLIGPYVMKGESTKDQWPLWDELKDYQAVVEKLANEYGICYLELQSVFNENAAKDGIEKYTVDGVHPVEAGAKLIANEWLKAFENNIEK
jgi:lysophospholipase L1-like esterase